MGSFAIKKKDCTRANPVYVFRFKNYVYSSYQFTYLVYFQTTCFGRLMELMLSGVSRAYRILIGIQYARYEVK